MGRVAQMRSRTLAAAFACMSVSDSLKKVGVLNYCFRCCFARRSGLLKCVSHRIHVETLVIGDVSHESPTRRREPRLRGKLTVAPVAVAVPFFFFLASSFGILRSPRAPKSRPVRP